MFTIREFCWTSLLPSIKQQLTEAPVWVLRLEQNSVCFSRPSSRSSELQIWSTFNRDIYHDEQRHIQHSQLHKKKNDWWKISPLKERPLTHHSHWSGSPTGGCSQCFGSCSASGIGRCQSQKPQEWGSPATYSECMHPENKMHTCF